MTYAVSFNKSSINFQQTTVFYLKIKSGALLEHYHKTYKFISAVKRNWITTETVRVQALKDFSLLSSDMSK